MRRWLGDQLRAAANLIDKPRPLVIQPVQIHVDGRAVAQEVLRYTLKQAARGPSAAPKPLRHVSLFERIIGHIFGWL